MHRFACVFLLLFPPVALGQPPKVLKPADAPSFRLRARVVSLGKKDPGVAKFTFRCSTAKPVAAAGSAWSDWLVFGKPQIDATLKGYPALYLRGYPVVTRLSTSPVVDPTAVEAELKFDESDEIFRLKGELFGPNLGILIWLEDGQPKAATMAAYNHRYWKHLEGVRIPENLRPKRFPIVDRFIGGDDDRIAWKEGIENLARAGFSVLMLPPKQEIRDLLLETGLRRTSWAVYNPPGYAFDFDPKITPASIQEWADKIAAPYLKAGYAKEDMALFAMSDEPGWYYPKMLEVLRKHPQALERFRSFLKDQGLQPADLGAASWDDVQPLGRSEAKDLPRRRLFYWTMRFFAHDSSRHFAASTRALENAFYPGLPVLTNWNFFAGRLYVPGPVANNPDKKSPDAAMGGHDWLEFGRLRGGTLLWTEDWFRDAQAYQWSWYCARLQAAARLGNVEFGAYVIPRTAGDLDDGILQRILAVVGHGGKAVKYFVFGPEYNFPGNCYSERARVLPKMAEAHRMIGAAEEFLWPGRKPESPVGIVFPRSSQMWDQKNLEIARGLSDATNTNLNGATVDYLAEAFDLYLALQHANIPCDVVDEDDLSPEKLRRFRVLYLTAPNLPVEGQRGLLEWTRRGGRLVLVSGAAQADRYDDPCTLLRKGLGLPAEDRDRLVLPNLNALKPAGKLQGKAGAESFFGPRGKGLPGAEPASLRFDDGTVAYREMTVGKGRAACFDFLPGLSYARSALDRKKAEADEPFSPFLREAIATPVRDAGIVPLVRSSHPYVETPVLLSEQGAAVTLLNWGGRPIQDLRLTFRLPFPVRTAASVRHGPLKIASTPDGQQVTLPLAAADILILRK